MKYLSVCSGIEAASVAWGSLGFQPVGFSEIEKFPCSVLSERFPAVTNYGDMARFQEWGFERRTIDILVGGTPCQSFSVAGLRGGLEDGRGNLALTYCRILLRYQPQWFVWENVPGVLSSNGGRDFGSILGAMAELGYGCSYRVLDAQNFGVPQRRRRVFVVGCLGDWRRSAEVLFERDCVCRDSKKSGKPKSKVAALTSNGVGTCGADDNQGQAGHLIPAAYRTAGDGAVYAEGNKTAPLTAGTDPSSNIVAIQERAVSENMNNGPGGCGYRTDGKAYTLEARPKVQAVAFSGRDRGDDGRGYSREPNITGSITETVDATKPPRVAGPTVGVRRLTPRECERLQGFPDDWTLVTHRGKPAFDGPRYKAIGNSMAVPVMRWIGQRIKEQNQRTNR
ncbi:MAG: DNA (cytosine-5-)-methyltransferase [Fuerstiella sp.]